METFITYLSHELIIDPIEQHIAPNPQTTAQTPQTTAAPLVHITSGINVNIPAAAPQIPAAAPHTRSTA